MKILKKSMISIVFLAIILFSMVIIKNKYNKGIFVNRWDNVYNEDNIAFFLWR